MVTHHDTRMADRVRREHFGTFSPFEHFAKIRYRSALAIDLPNGMKQGQVLELAGRSELRFRTGLISQITDVSMNGLAN